MMRVGVLADIHGNLPALEVAVAALRRAGVDRYVHLGDVVGYGPFPNECVQLVTELGATGVVGNHELIVLGELSAERCTQLARETLSWTAQVITAATRSYISSLPRQAIVAPSTLATHAALDDPQRYVLTARQAVAELTSLEERAPDMRLLLIGHTHFPRAYSIPHGEARLGRAVTALGEDRWLLNPGSVGQSRSRRALASCMVLDLSENSAQFLSLRYDTGRTRSELRRRGLDEDACHSPPSALGRARRLARDAFRVEKVAR
jgi:predicted phosphodiesterase